MSTTTAFDLERFTRAAEERDAGAQLSMYGPAATVTILDKISQPSSPRVLRGREEISTGQVACATVIALESGQIKDQTVVQVWDESN